MMDYKTIWGICVPILLIGVIIIAIIVVGEAVRDISELIKEFVNWISKKKEET